MACAVVFTPMLLIIGQKETGSALVYLSFFLVFYREGMPGSILFTGVAMVFYFVVGIKYENIWLWDTPTSVGKFIVLLFVQIFTAGMVYVYCHDKKKTQLILNYSLSITLIFLLFSEYVISNTPGVAAASMTLLGFVQPSLAQLFVPRDSQENLTPSVESFGESKFVWYTFFSVFLYCIVFYTLEAFNLFNWLYWLGCIFGSTLLTVLLILGIEHLTGSFRKN